MTGQRAHDRRGPDHATGDTGNGIRDGDQCCAHSQPTVMGVMLYRMTYLVGCNSNRRE